MMRIIYLLTFLFLTACSSEKTYESDVFPTGDWHPINPTNFDKTQAQKILEGKIR